MVKKRSKKKTAPNRDLKDLPKSHPNQVKFRRLFISGLNGEITKGRLRKFFKRWGRIEYCKVIKPNFNLGLLVYKSAKHVNKALSCRPHFIGKTEIYARRAIPIYSNAETRAFKEIIVGKLDENTPEDDIRNIFSKYGNIKDINMIRDIITGGETPYCSIIFDDHDAVDKCIITQYFQLGSKTIEAKRASPKDCSIFRRLFVDGLSYKTTEEALRAHFEKWGQVVDCDLIDNPSTDFYASGFITYQSSEQLEAAQSNRPHIIDDKRVHTRRANPHGGSRETTASRQIFVRGLKENTSKNDIYKVFSHYGIVEYINMITDRDTGKRKPNCFVTFKDYDSADKCILIQNFHLGPTTLSVNRVFPKEDADHGSDEASDGSGDNSSVNLVVNATELTITEPTVTEPLDENAGISIDSEGTPIIIDMDLDSLYEEVFKTRMALIMGILDKMKTMGLLVKNEVANDRVLDLQEWPGLV